jgi:hypothetical protein
MLASRKSPARRPRGWFANALLAALAVPLAAPELCAETAQDESSPAAAAAPTSSAALADELKRLQEEKEKNPGDKLLDELLLLAQDTLAQLKQAEADDAAARRLREEAQAAPAAVSRAKADLAALPLRAALESPDDADLERLNQELLQLQAAKAQAAAARDQSAADEQRRAREAAEIPQQLNELHARIAELDKQLAAPPAMGEAARLVEARQRLRQAQKQATEAAIARWEAQQTANAATIELGPLLKELANRRSALVDEQLKLLRQRIKSRRLADAAAELKQAEEIAAGEQRQVLKDLAEGNLALAQARTRVVRQAGGTAQELDEIKKLLTHWQAQFDRTREKIEKVGLTNAIGLLMRRQRGDLPSQSDWESPTSPNALGWKPTSAAISRRAASTSRGCWPSTTATSPTWRTWTSRSTSFCSSSRSTTASSTSTYSGFAAKRRCNLPTRPTLARRRCGCSARRRGRTASRRCGGTSSRIPRPCWRSVCWC